VALDAATGRVFWIYHYNNGAELRVCCGANNRGLAILGDTLFMGTLDAHLVAIDTKSGRPLWKTRVADSKSGYSLTVAPLAVKDRVIVGVGGGEMGIRGFLAAFDAKTGRELWKFYTIPGPGEPGHETWEPCPPNPASYCDPEAWKHGSGSVWVTGSFDPDLNLNYWGIGNVGPDYNPDQRPGDNLYTASVVALDTDTGKFLLGKPFVKVNWMSAFDERGKPIQTPQPPGMPTYPAVQGGSNWYSPSYSPRTKLFYVSSWQNNGQLFGG